MYAQVFFNRKKRDLKTLAESEFELDLVRVKLIVPHLDLHQGKVSADRLVRDIKTVRLALDRVYAYSKTPYTTF